MTLTASAPGKLVLLGEYAVLEGAPGVVMAVNRRVRVRVKALSRGQLCSLGTYMPHLKSLQFAPDKDSGVGILDAVRAQLKPECSFKADIDSAAFFSPEGQKYGLGSSAAVICALYAALSRLTPGANEGLPKLSNLLEVQQNVQGGGSGIDLAASLQGGILKYRRRDSKGAVLSPLEWGSRILLSCVFTGVATKTADMLVKWRAFKGDNSAGYRRLYGEMAAVAAAGCSAFEQSNPGGLVRAIGHYGELLGELGTAMKVDLVTAAHRHLRTLAEDCGGAYKPSGAGGGDVGFGCFTDPGGLLAFNAAVDAAGYRWLDLTLDSQGLSVEE